MRLSSLFLGNPSEFESVSPVGVFACLHVLEQCYMLCNSYSRRCRSVCRMGGWHVLETRSDLVSSHRCGELLYPRVEGASLRAIRVWFSSVEVCMLFAPVVVPATTTTDLTKTFDPPLTNQPCNPPTHPRTHSSRHPRLPLAGCISYRARTLFDVGVDSLRRT